ncbi:hypothetical protein QZH41_003659 [Actinostola sp. cb2023]|nr:hypothetical protein QZH41_003659 [Actinostola sp. cb2023]
MSSSDSEDRVDKTRVRSVVQGGAGTVNYKITVCITNFYSCLCSFGVHYQYKAVFERLRSILHSGEIDRRVEYMIEVMFAIRKDGFKPEFCIMIIDCCAQQRSYEKFFGLLAQYETIHRLETNKLRNVAKFFGHLLFTDAVPWTKAQVKKARAKVNQRILKKRGGEERKGMS